GPWRRVLPQRACSQRSVSISTEMPGPWRLLPLKVVGIHLISFNLNRDARPLATHLHKFPRLAVQGFNLNRDARPLATRFFLTIHNVVVCFNLNRDARPLATSGLMYSLSMSSRFQSQPRCQAPGDLKLICCMATTPTSFNLNRDARPLATVLPALISP